MNDAFVAQYRNRLAEKLAETLNGPLPSATPRRVHGVVSLPHKATVVVGMRALEDVSKVYPKAVRRLLTLTRDATPREVPNRVVVQLAYEWLLSPE